MKKVRYGCLSILCAMMIMGLTACGGGDTTSTKASETNRTTSAASGIEATTTDNHKESGSSTGADTSQESTGVIDGLMDGVADDRFHPEGTASRAMVWAILARMNGETVTGEGWAEAARAWAMETGVSDGEDGGAPVTREQLAAMLYRYAARKGWDVTERADLSAFADGDDVSPWALDALAWASAAGIVEGSAPATLEPQGEAVRAQLAAMLARFCENVAEV